MVSSDKKWTKNWQSRWKSAIKASSREQPCTTMAKENFDKRYENAAEVGEVEQYIAIGLCNEARLKTSDEWWVGERCCGAGLSEA